MIKANFGLIKQNSKVSFSFIQASDTHISEASIDRMDKFQEAGRSLHPDLILITGDLVQDALRVSEAEAPKYTPFKTESSKLKVPLWLVPGNHEIFWYWKTFIPGEPVWIFIWKRKCITAILVPIIIRLIMVEYIYCFE